MRPFGRSNTLSSKRKALALAVGVFLVLLAGVVWWPKVQPVSLNFAGFATNSTHHRFAVFRITNDGDSAYRIVGGSLEPVDQAARNTLIGDVNIDPLSPHQTQTVELAMAPLPGRWRLAVVRIGYEPRPLRNRVTSWLSTILEIMPEGILKGGARSFVVGFGGVHTVKSAPFDGNPDNLPTGAAGGSR